MLGVNVNAVLFEAEVVQPQSNAETGFERDNRVANPAGHLGGPGVEDWCVTCGGETAGFQKD